MSLNKLSSKSQIRLYYQRWIPNVIIAHFISCLCFINSYDYDTLLIRLILLKHTSPYLSSKYNPLSFQNSKYYLSWYFTPKLRLLLGKTLQESKVNYDQFNNLIKLFLKINFNTTPIEIVLCENSKTFIMYLFVFILLKEALNIS